MTGACGHCQPERCLAAATGGPSVLDWRASCGSSRSRHRRWPAALPSARMAAWSGRASLDVALTHSERLMSMVDRLLAGLPVDASARCRDSPCPSARARSRGSGSARPPSRAWPWRLGCRSRRCPRSMRSPPTCRSPMPRCARSSTPARARCTACLYQWTGRRHGAALGLPGAAAAGRRRLAARAGDRARRRGARVPTVSRAAGRRGARGPRARNPCHRRRCRPDRPCACWRRGRGSAGTPSSPSISGPPRRS